MDQNHKKILQLREDYKITFGSDEGKRVYSDLEKRCHENMTTHDKTNSHEKNKSFIVKTLLLIGFIGTVKKNTR